MALQLRGEVVDRGEVDVLDGMPVTQGEEGVREGDAVGLLARNGRGFVEAAVALAKCGADVLYLGTGTAPAQLAEVLDREGARLIALAGIGTTARPALDPATSMRLAADGNAAPFAQMAGGDAWRTGKQKGCGRG